MLLHFWLFPGFKWALLALEAAGQGLGSSQLANQGWGGSGSWQGCGADGTGSSGAQRALNPLLLPVALPGRFPVPVPFRSTAAAGKTPPSAPRDCQGWECGNVPAPFIPAGMPR